MKINNRTSILILASSIVIIILGALIYERIYFPTSKEILLKFEIKRTDGGTVYLSSYLPYDSSVVPRFEAAAYLLFANTSVSALRRLCPFYKDELNKIGTSSGYSVWGPDGEVVTCVGDLPP